MCPNEIRESVGPAFTWKSRQPCRSWKCKSRSPHQAHSPCSTMTCLDLGVAHDSAHRIRLTQSTTPPNHGHEVKCFPPGSENKFHSGSTEFLIPETGLPIPTQTPEQLPVERASRKIVCLVGSRKDWRLLREAERQETQNGNIVLTVGCLGPEPDSTRAIDDHSPEETEKCIALHFDKIRLADEVLWVTATGFPGEHTQQDLDLAKKLGKPIHIFLVPVEEGKRVLAFLTPRSSEESDIS